MNITSLFKQPTAQQQALKELNNAQLELLQVLRAKEHYTAMAQCLNLTVKRLSSFVENKNV